jgi:hypothetical protein
VQESCHSPGEARKSAGFGNQKSARSRHANRSRSALAAGLLFEHTCFRPCSIGNLDWKSGVHVPNRAILERETGSNAKSNPFLGRWNAGGRGSRSNPKKLDWTRDLERPVETLLHDETASNDAATRSTCSVGDVLAINTITFCTDLS